MFLITCLLYRLYSVSSFFSELVSALKRVRHKIFDLHFFHDSNPSGPLINRLKYFRIQFRFRPDIQILKKLRGVHPTFLRCAAHCGIKLCSVHHTAESSNHNFLKNSVVCIPQQSQTSRCTSPQGVKLRGVHHTLESSSAV